MVTLISIMIFFQVQAPPSNSGCIFASEVFQPYKTIIHAIGATETNHDTLAYNPREQAVGYFQVRPIRLRDFNERTGSNYTMQDLYSYEISEKIFLYYATQFRYDDYKGMAYEWNKSVTDKYWNKVQKFLNRNKNNRKL